MSASHSESYLTVDEWHALERSSDVKHEYIDGQVYAMSGGTRAHAHVAGVIYARLLAALEGGPCLPYTSDVATQVSSTRYTYADVVVSCSDLDAALTSETTITEPKVIFKVLSESTERIDRGRKWDDYRTIASLQEYILVGTAYQRAEAYRRTSNGWSLYCVFGPTDEIVLTSLDVQLSVADLYDRTDVPTNDAT